MCVYLPALHQNRPGCISASCVCDLRTNCSRTSSLPKPRAPSNCQRAVYISSCHPDAWMVCVLYIQLRNESVNLSRMPTSHTQTHTGNRSQVLPRSRGWSCMQLSPCCPQCCWWVYTGPPLQLAVGKIHTCTHTHCMNTLLLGLLFYSDKKL